MNQLQKRLLDACNTLGLKINIDFRTTVQPDLTAIHIPDLGAPKGMLVVESFDEIQSCVQELLNAGYGYSVLSSENGEDESSLDTYIEIFSDWGWSGDEKEKPSWMV